MPYETDEMVLGYLQQELVTAIHMPRETFLGVVAQALDEPQYEPIAEKMLATAATMERFPIGRWIDKTRGCGCVVGEYLVAADLIPRDVEGDPYDSVRRVLAGRPDGDALTSFGSRIDSALRRHLVDTGTWLGVWDSDDFAAPAVLVFGGEVE